MSKVVKWFFGFHCTLWFCFSLLNDLGDGGKTFMNEELKFKKESDLLQPNILSLTLSVCRLQRTVHSMRACESAHNVQDPEDPRKLSHSGSQKKTNHIYRLVRWCLRQEDHPSDFRLGQEISSRIDKFMSSANFWQNINAISQLLWAKKVELEWIMGVAGKETDSFINLDVSTHILNLG